MGREFGRQCQSHVVVVTTMWLLEETRQIKVAGERSVLEDGQGTVGEHTVPFRCHVSDFLAKGTVGHVRRRWQDAVLTTVVAPSSADNFGRSWN